MSIVLNDLEQAVPLIKSGAVGIIKTDTVYGIVASAVNEPSVNRIYKIKKRDINKKFIILGANYSQLKIFKIKDYIKYQKLSQKYWPGPYSLILPVNNSKFKYLYHNTLDIAFRIPNNKVITDFLLKTGPLVAPSANLQGEPTVASIQDAKSIFKDSVDFYVDGGSVLNVKPSTIINMSTGQTLR